MIDLVTQFLDGSIGELDLAFQASKIKAALKVEVPKNPEL